MPEKPESESEKTTRIGSLMVAKVFGTGLLACVALGAYQWLKERLRKPPPTRGL